MTMSRKVLLFLFMGLVLMQSISIFFIGLLSQRLSNALMLLNQDQPLDAGLGYIWIGSIVMGLAMVAIGCVLAWELGKEKITLDVNLHEPQ
jgi:hypothetical protein